MVVDVRSGTPHRAGKSSPSRMHKSYTPQSLVQNIRLEDLDAVVPDAIVLTVIERDERDFVAVRRKPARQKHLLALGPPHMAWMRGARKEVIAIQADEANANRGHTCTSMSRSDCSKEIVGTHWVASRSRVESP